MLRALREGVRRIALRRASFLAVLSSSTGTSDEAAGLVAVSSFSGGRKERGRGDGDFHPSFSGVGSVNMRAGLKLREGEGDERSCSGCSCAFREGLAVGEVVRGKQRGDWSSRAARTPLVVKEREEKERGGRRRDDDDGIVSPAPFLPLRSTFDMARTSHGAADSFAQAVSFISASSVSSSSETKLRVGSSPRVLASAKQLTTLLAQIYSLYKISTSSSRPPTPRPGIWDFTARAKWDSWTALGNSGEYEGVEGQDKAKRDYEEVARGLGWMGEEVEGEPVVPLEKKREGGGMVSVSRMAPEEPPGGA